MMKLRNWLALGLLAMLALMIVACDAGSVESEPIAKNADGYANINVQPFEFNLFCRIKKQGSGLALFFCLGQSFL